MDRFIFQYEIIGHSGEGHKFDFVKANKAPKNNKERLDAIKVINVSMTSSTERSKYCQVRPTQTRTTQSVRLSQLETRSKANWPKPKLKQNASYMLYK